MGGRRSKSARDAGEVTVSAAARPRVSKQQKQPQQQQRGRAEGDVEHEQPGRGNVRTPDAAAAAARSRVAATGGGSDAASAAAARARVAAAGGGSDAALAIASRSQVAATGGGSDEAAAAAEPTAAVSVWEQPLRTAMRLHIVRSNMVHTHCQDAAAAAAGSLAMDAAVWRNLPDDILWKVVAIVPAPKRFQWQVVSRQWRRVLSSAEFYKAVTVAAHERRDAEPVVVAHVLPGDDSLVVPAYTGRLRTPEVVDVHMDLSFLPRAWFQGLSDPGPNI